MFRKLFACALMAGILGLCAQDALAQDLGAFPVDRRRAAPEEDGMITNARLSSTGFGFLKLTTNARAVGMGDSYSAVGNDISAIFYNPAGITQMETERAAQAGYTSWVVGSTLGTGAFAVKTGIATFGISAIFFQSGRHWPDSSYFRRCTRILGCEAVDGQAVVRCPDSLDQRGS